MGDTLERRTLADLSERMRDIDFAMLSTKADGGAIGSRPMSNNHQVDYAGDSYYFTYDDTTMVADISRDPQVGLSFLGSSGLLGRRPFFVAIEGTAWIIHDRALFANHWSKDLDHWFEEGLDTPGLVMIRVNAHRIHYWDGKEEGEIRL